MASRQFFDRWVCRVSGGKAEASLRALDVRGTADRKIDAAAQPASAGHASNRPVQSGGIGLGFLARPAEFAEMCLALPAERKDQYVFVDEAQAVPAIFDAVQHLYDGDKARWRFVLCGSSARRLRRTGANMLPGRSFMPPALPPDPSGATGPVAEDFPRRLTAADVLAETRKKRGRSFPHGIWMRGFPMVLFRGL